MWTDACAPAWTRLKEALVSDAILVYPDYARDSLLDCDGSGEGLGAALLQEYDEGAYHCWSTRNSGQQLF